jgi:two-component system, cell cycle sensor histidine kinase and response regulator CckA
MMDRFAEFFELAPDAVFVVDADGTIGWMNAQAEQMFGYSSHELVGDSVDRVLPTRSADNSRGRRRDGAEFPADIMHGFVDHNGARVGVAIVRDTTVRERAALVMREREERFRELVNQASDGIFVADRDGRYLDVNSAGCRLLGCEREEIVGKTIVDFIPPEDLDRLGATRERLLAGGVDVGEWELRHKDGYYIPVEVSAKMLADGRRQGIVRDITERKEAADAQTLLLNQLRTALQEIKVLSGLLSICMYCRRIRTDDGGWTSLEAYVRRQQTRASRTASVPSASKPGTPRRPTLVRLGALFFGFVGEFRGRRAGYRPTS